MKHKTQKCKGAAFQSKNKSCPPPHRTPATLSFPCLPLPSLVRSSSGPVTIFLGDPARGQQVWDTQPPVLVALSALSEQGRGL